MQIVDRLMFLKSLLKEDKKYSKLELKNQLLLKNYKELENIICDLIYYEIEKKDNFDKYICSLERYIKEIFNNRINTKIKIALRELSIHIDNNEIKEKIDFDFVLEIIEEKQDKFLKKLVKQIPDIVNCQKEDIYLFEKIVKDHIEICKNLKEEDYNSIFYNEKIIKIFLESEKILDNPKIKNLINIINKVIESEKTNFEKDKNIKKGSIYFLENLRNLIKENKVSEEHLNFKHNIKTDFSKEAYLELSNLKSINSNVFDLTNLYTISIDNLKTVEIDDAISLESLNNGNKLLYIHISNPSNYIKIGSQLEREAYERIETLYLCDKTLFMFPFQICGDICSLKANNKRYVNTVVYELDKNNNIVNHMFLNAFVKVNQNLSYLKADEILKKENFNKNDNKDPNVKTLRSLKKIANSLCKKNKCNNSKKMIECFMNQVNITYATEFNKLKYPFIYRVQPKINLEFKENLSDFFIKKNIDKKTLFDSLAEPFYSKENIGHCNMGPSYAHLTNPIRSYVDYLNQVAVSRFLINNPDDEELKFFDDLVCNSFVSEINKVKKEHEGYVSDYNKIKSLTKK